MRIPFASMTMDIAYNQDKKITIRRFPTKYETEELKKSKYKLVDEETYISDNQIELNMFYNTRRKSIKVISGGLYDFKEGGRYGVDIDLKMRHPEKELNNYLSGIIRQLCKKYLKPCILFPSRYSINCEIDECRLTEDTVKKFLEDFVTTIEGTIDEIKLIREEKKIEEKAEEQLREIEKEEICADCGKDLKFEKVEHWYDDEKDEVINVCPDCWSIRRQGGRDIVTKPVLEEVIQTKSEKMSKKWKAILTGLSVLAIITIFLLLDALFELF